MPNAVVRARRRLAQSPLAPAAAFPVRLIMVLRRNASQLKVSISWLLTSREHTNFTYELTALNREHLAWFVAGVAGVSVQEARGYMQELDGDDALRAHVLDATRTSRRRRLADEEVRYGRRLGWYALVRAVKPRHVVETGTDKGLGSCVLAAALLRNGTGRLTTLDINPESGYLIGGPYADVVDVVVGDSVALLASLDEVDLFLHDSDHRPEYERAEYQAVAPKLAPGALVLSDNAHETNELAEWAERKGMSFAFFGERPEGHWAAGDGIGVARSEPPSRSASFAVDAGDHH